MHKNTVAKLKEAFLLGCTVDEACFYAEIHRATYYRWVAETKEGEDFNDKKDQYKQRPFYLSRKILTHELEKGDKDIARWMIDKKDGRARETIQHRGLEVLVKDKKTKDIIDDL